MGGQVTRKNVLNRGYWRIPSKEELERVRKWAEEREREAKEYFKRKYGASEAPADE